VELSTLQVGQRRQHTTGEQQEAVDINNDGVGDEDSDDEMEPAGRVWKEQQAAGPRRREGKYSNMK